MSQDYYRSLQKFEFFNTIGWFCDGLLSGITMGRRTSIVPIMGESMPLLLLFGIMTTAITSAPPREVDKAVCAVGKVALHDLTVIDRAPRAEKFYNGRTDQYHRDLLEVCPVLIKNLPHGFNLATNETFQRVVDLRTAAPVSIFDVEVPELNSNSDRAIVRMGYSCNGLCGARFEATYVLTQTGWKRDGEPRILAVS
jgi:hypothetical protein